MISNDSFLGAVLRPPSDRRGEWLTAALAMVCCATLAAPAAAQLGGRRPTSQVVDGIGITPSLGSKVAGELTFIDSFGEPVALGALFGERPVVLHLVYYECPMLCKLSSDGLLKSLATLSLKPGEDFSIVTVSFDPREGPELSSRAREMAIERVGREAVETGWTFLTGEEAEIAALCDSVGFRYRWEERSGQYAHGTGALVLTPDGTLSRYLAGIEYSPRDLRLAIVEASQGKVGTAIDQVMLLCYMYDPTAGKYGLAVVTAVRVAGVATVTALGGAIFLMLRRERRRTRMMETPLTTTWAGRP